MFTGPAIQTKLLKHFQNECHICDALVGVKPDATFAKPVGGAMLTIKQTREEDPTQAVTEELSE